MAAANTTPTVANVVGNLIRRETRRRSARPLRPQGKFLVKKEMVITSWDQNDHIVFFQFPTEYDVYLPSTDSFLIKMSDYTDLGNIAVQMDTDPTFASSILTNSQSWHDEVNGGFNSTLIGNTGEWQGDDWNVKGYYVALINVAVAPVTPVTVTLGAFVEVGVEVVDLGSESVSV